MTLSGYKVSSQKRYKRKQILGRKNSQSTRPVQKYKRSLFAKYTVQTLALTIIRHNTYVSLDIVCLANDKG